MQGSIGAAWEKLNPVAVRFEVTIMAGNGRDADG
jgi:hypothetical protein